MVPSDGRDGDGVARAESLRRRWHAQSYERTNLGWVEWNDPAVEPVIDDVTAGRDPWLSLRALVRARAKAGLTISEVVGDLGALRDVDGTGGTRALASLDAAVLIDDWYAENVARRHQEYVQDPLTGLATTEFLKQYLRQLYGSVASLGLVDFGHKLLIVDLPLVLVGVDLMAAQVATAALLTQHFTQGLTMTVFHPYRQGVLVSDDYGDDDELKARLDDLDVFPSGAKPSLSLLDLPSSATAASNLIDNLAEASAISYGEIPELERQIEAATETLASLQAEQRFLKEEVDAEDVAEVVSRWTGVPVSRLLEGEVEKLIRMEDALHARVVGQDEAVSAVANAIRRSRAGLSDPNRPIGSFLFLGPTGVGKTELARSLADFLFDDAKAMVRIDMGEYTERHSVARLVGAPPGYVGYEEGGQLTEAVRRRPYAVVLLDELEKAHPDVFNILLQVLEDGRLTDGQGRTVDFTNAVLIMTSNLVGEPSASFNPEFVNRIDEIVRFHWLSEADLERIVSIQLNGLRGRLAERRLSLAVTPAAAAYLARAGFDPDYGARPLRRVIQREVEDPMAMALLEGRYPEGSTVTVDEKDGAVVLT